MSARSWMLSVLLLLAGSATVFTWFERREPSPPPPDLSHGISAPTAAARAAAPERGNSMWPRPTNAARAAQVSGVRFALRGRVVDGDQNPVRGAGLFLDG